MEDIITYDSPEKQFVDLFSRLGISEVPGSQEFGIGRAHLAIQREGKTFFEPLLRIGIYDENKGNPLFISPGELATRRIKWYPWGYVQEGKIDSILLSVTVTYAKLDVIATKIEVLNKDANERSIKICLHGQAVEEDMDKFIQFDQDRNQIIVQQTSIPSSRTQLRQEPDFRIITAVRPSFVVGQVEAGKGTYKLISQDQDISTGEKAEFSVLISAAGYNLAKEEQISQEDYRRSYELVRDRVALHKKEGINEIIYRSKRRWEETLKKLPLDEGKEYNSVIRQAAIILLKNTIIPQPEQRYGTEMGNHHGTFPSRFGYEGFWIWDSAKHVLGFIEWNLDLAKENILIMLNQQNSETGQLSMLHPDSKYPGAQPPLLAWSAMKIYEKESQDKSANPKAFLNEIYPKLAKWNQWWFSHSDKNGDSIAEWPDNLSSGLDNSPRWDNECEAGYENDYGSVLYSAIDLNSYLVVDMKELARMAQILGHQGEARVWKKRAWELAKSIVEICYDLEDNLFYDAHYVTGKFNKVKTLSSFLPLWAGVPLSEKNIKKMIQNYLLNEDHFFGEFPFPSVAYSDIYYNESGSNGYWRGPVWLDHNYIMLDILYRYRNILDPEYRNHAEKARGKILDMVRDNGIYENYNSKTGKRGDYSKEHFSWSAASAIAIALRRFDQGQTVWNKKNAVMPFPIHIGIELRDHKIYARQKEVKLYLINRKDFEISGTLVFTPPEEWKKEWRVEKLDGKNGGLDNNWMRFTLTPKEENVHVLRFLIPQDSQAGDYIVNIEAKALGPAGRIISSQKVSLNKLAMESLKPLPWISRFSTSDIEYLLWELAPFDYTCDGQLINSSEPGLIGREYNGLLFSRLHFIGNKFFDQHIKRDDFIKHVIMQVEKISAAEDMIKEFKQILNSDVNPRERDDQARQLIERVVQELQDIYYDKLKK